MSNRGFFAYSGVTSTVGLLFFCAQRVQRGRVTGPRLLRPVLVHSDADPVSYLYCTLRVKPVRLGDLADVLLDVYLDTAPVA